MFGVSLALILGTGQSQEPNLRRRTKIMAKKETKVASKSTKKVLKGGSKVGNTKLMFTL
jgi:hypothetical protein